VKYNVWLPTTHQILLCLSILKLYSFTYDWKKQQDTYCCFNNILLLQRLFKPRTPVIKWWHSLTLLYLYLEKTRNESTTGIKPNDTQHILVWQQSTTLRKGNWYFIKLQMKWEWRKIIMACGLWVSTYKSATCMKTNLPPFPYIGLWRSHSSPVCSNKGKLYIVCLDNILNVVFITTHTHLW
jgi:hypothetical protein